MKSKQSNWFPLTKAGDWPKLPGEWLLPSPSPKLLPSCHVDRQDRWSNMDLWVIYASSSTLTNRRRDHMHCIQEALEFTKSTQPLLLSTTWTLSHAICVLDFNRKQLPKSLQCFPFFRVTNMSKLCNLFFFYHLCLSSILLKAIIDPLQILFLPLYTWVNWGLERFK